MSDLRLNELLVQAGDDGRARAELEAWPVVRAAFASERPLSRRRPRHRLLLAVATTLAAIAIVASAISSPSAVAHWLRDRVVGKPGVSHSAPALTRLPGGGRLLVAAHEGVWVVQPDGSRRLLRGYTGATWSPRGLYLGAWRSHELFALEPNGRVHWSLARPGLVRAADWSPDGYRIAYLAGRSLRVVAGDGTGDAQLRQQVAPVPPVWRPNAPHMLLFAASPHVVDLVATDVQTAAWRRELTFRVRWAAWSADGRVAAIAGRRRVAVLDGDTGHVVSIVDAPAGQSIRALAFANHGPRLAVVLQSRTGQSRVGEFEPRLRRASPRQLFAGPGSFSGLSWSPDDRWLLVSWPDADQWLFLNTSGRGGIRAVSDVAGQFEPGSRRAVFPSVGGWCC